MRFPRLHWLLLLPLLSAALVVALVCSNAPPASNDPAAPAPASFAPQATDPAPSGALHAVLINGGERRQVNYRSHREHLKELLDRLRAGGVDPARVTIFASDGPDPAPDLAIRERNDLPDFWLLPRSGVAEHLKPRMEFVNTELDGVTLRPATRQALAAWFEHEGTRLGEGDTLLIYVTDHGHKNRDDLDDNTISLWGESLSVREFQTYLDGLDPRVRTVLLMSQCYGGSFANAIFSSEAPHPLRGNVCGYFATTASRLAYGCYPENRGREGVGYSHRVLAALGELGELPRAHRRTLVTDRTPDVPNTTREFYLKRLMEREAEFAGRPTDAFIDEWLREAWTDRGAWEAEIRLLDHIAHSFGLFSPRTLAELDGQAEGLPALSEQLKTYAKRWKEALEAAKLENWRRFAFGRPEWRKRFQTQAVRALTPEDRAELAEELLAEFVPFTLRQRGTHQRLLSLKRKQEDAAAARYRAEVRIGSVLRMRTVLTSIAGRAYLQALGAPEQRSDYEQLARCEDLSLPQPETRIATFEPPTPLPRLEDDRKLIESVMPSWMGIRYQKIQPARRQALDLPRGAVRVIAVYPESPAEEAGLRVNDLVLGTPGEPFAEPHSIREWTMFSTLGRPTTLQLLRGEEPIELTLIPGSYPLELPKLPGPPKVGSAAPPVEVEPYRGGRLLASGSRLLFFWATWCGPCKQALPELLAFGDQRDVEILAITDEQPEELDAFFETFSERFPERVASDQERTTFQRFGVSGTPTFVLLDDGGSIRHYQRGYRIGSGLQIDGWSYVLSNR